MSSPSATPPTIPSSSSPRRPTSPCSSACSARAAPEQLYLTREAIAARTMPWEPEFSLVHLRLHRDDFLNQPVRQRPTGPVRKGPCPCGSGKKYKRCCGEAEGEGEAGEA